MGKATIIIFLALLFPGSENPETGLNDLQRLYLKGRVRSVMEIKYTRPPESDQTVKTREVYRKLMRFDEYGYISEIILYNQKNEIFLRSVFSSGPDDKPVEMNEYKADGSLNLRVTYAYSPKGQRERADYFWTEDREIGEICEMYDYYFDIIQKELFSTVIYKSEYRGYYTEERFMKSDGNTTFYLASKYDFRGNRLESAYHHGNGNLSWITKYEYDKNDHLIRSRVLKSNRIAVESLYEYVFDDEGNWTTKTEKRTVHVNIFTAGLDPSNMITERTIEYY